MVPILYNGQKGQHTLHLSYSPGVVYSIVTHNGNTAKPPIHVQTVPYIHCTSIKSFKGTLGIVMNHHGKTYVWSLKVFFNELQMPPKSRLSELSHFYQDHACTCRSLFTAKHTLHTSIPCIRTVHQQQIMACILCSMNDSKFEELF